VRIIGRFAKGPLQFDTAVFGAGKIDPVIDIGTIEFDVSK
jgi:hypothetical protein